LAAAIFLNSSNNTNTSEEPIDLNRFDKFPFQKAERPSFARIFYPQSLVPLYITSFRPDYIINLLLIVSNGYDTNSENVVIA